MQSSPAVDEEVWWRRDAADVYRQAYMPSIGQSAHCTRVV